jgi:ribonuclease T2
VIARLIAGALALALPGLASAQALSCAADPNPPRPHPELPSAAEPQRTLPIGGYTLAITWAPEYCHDKGSVPGATFECGGGSRFGFALHGLWPDGIGKDWPQYCRSTPLLPPALIRQHLCATPSAQLLQHEWAKHGTCMARDPASYFARSTGLYAGLHYPDSNALSRDPALTVGKFADAFAAANPGMRADMVRVTVNPHGWLDELWLCLDTSFRYTRCRPGTGGAPREAALKIWRGSRADSGGYRS